MVVLICRVASQVLAWLVARTPSWVKPNHVTIFRIVLVAPVAILFGNSQNFWSTVVLALAVLSDALDGALAKVRKQKTKLGEVLDPLADKLLIVTLLIEDVALFGWSHFLAEFVIGAIALEVALTIGRIIKMLLGKSGGANEWGKTKMHFQSAAVICVVIGAGWTLAAANLYLGVAVVLAAMSFIGHFFGTFVRNQPAAG
jgi:CDP-diacylglycerol--glycerol-3-phosphate 3-phosphatidyltransferase